MKRLKRKNLKRPKKAVKVKRHKTVKNKDVIEEITEKSGVYKTAEFKAYVIWKSLPAMLRGEGKATLNKFGIDDEISISMLEIKTQAEFAEKFKIKKGTCSEWNKILVDENLINKNIHRWAKMITPNIVMALGKTAVKTGKAPEVLAWQKLIEGWEEKSKMGLDATPELVEILAKVNKMLPE